MVEQKQQASGRNRRRFGGQRNRKPRDADANQDGGEGHKRPNKRAFSATQNDGSGANSGPMSLSGAAAGTAPSQLAEAPPPDAARFADLVGTTSVDPKLIRTITDDLKFEHMTSVQAATIRELLPPHRNDCLVQAKTGTGKTLAFLVPAIQTMFDRTPPSSFNSGDSPVSILVISPTRELAMQIATEATNLLKRFPQYNVRIAIGGTNKDQEEKRILAGCDILVATPGRLLDHLANDGVQHALRSVATLVLDEADRLLDMGFMRDLREIVQKLPNRNSTNRQGMLFSATIAEHVNQAANLVLKPGYKFISTIPAGEANVHQRVPQLLVTVDTFSHVPATLVGAIREETKQHKDFKAIIFAPTAHMAGLYGHILSQIPDMPPCSTLSSRLTQNRRTKITNDFRDARAAILVATDVVARGMDFPGVTTVFQVGIPSDKESYIHRIGRTARAGAEGRGIFIVTEDESWFPRWTLKDIKFAPHEADLSSVETVVSITQSMDETDRARIYQAWLGYYKNHLKSFKWDSEHLVAMGNAYARDGLQCPESPALFKSTVGKMGLKGVKGLTVVPDPPRDRKNQGQGGRGGGRR